MASVIGAYVFALAGKADADNIIPVIWEVSRDGSTCVVVVCDRGVHEAIRMSWWLRERPSVHVIGRYSTDGPPTLFERLRRVRWNRFVLRRLLRRHDAKVVAVQWREGIAHDSAGVVRRMIRWWSTDYFTQLQFAARDLEIPTVALPHGHSTKTTLIRSTHVRDKAVQHGGTLPFADRDSFAAYVFCSNYHRDVILGNSNMNPRNVQVWGSPRFNDQWVSELYAHTPSVTLPPLRTDALRRVLFFVPKWNNLVDRGATMHLIAALGADERVQLVLRGHLRAEAAALTHSEQAMLAKANIVVVADDVSSSSLIAACDVLVDVDSSIAFDAVILNKPYVRPRYLQDASVQTIWDQLGGAHQTNSLAETVQVLTSASLAPAPRDASFEQVVFGGSGAEVLERYRLGLQQLAC
jgi:hypothetical protein